MNTAQTVQNFSSVQSLQRSMHAQRLNAIVNIASGTVSSSVSATQEIFKQTLSKTIDNKSLKSAAADKTEKKEISKALYAVLGGQCAQKFSSCYDNENESVKNDAFKTLFFQMSNNSDCSASANSQCTDVEALITLMNIHLDDLPAGTNRSSSDLALIRHLTDLLGELMLHHSLNGANLLASDLQTQSIAKEILTVYILLINLAAKERTSKNKYSSVKQSVKDKRKQIQKRIAQYEDEQKENMAQFALSFIF